MIKHFLKPLIILLIIGVFNMAVADNTQVYNPGLTPEQLKFLNDISISLEGVDTPEDIIIGKTVRIYATVDNPSDKDIKGVVRFYNERTGSYVGTDQPFSAVAGGSDTVFVDITPMVFGGNDLAIRVIPENETGDNPDNNKVISTLYVDEDSDGDGSANRNDPDDDNDGVPDVRDDFPFNKNESQDSDGNGIGNNEDTDDDGDGVLDVEDVFPIDASEFSDRDGDGIGDNNDRFPDDPGEWEDSDNDEVGDNSDPDNSNHGPVLVIGTSSGGGGGSSRGHNIISSTPNSSIEPQSTDVNFQEIPRGTVGEIITFNALKTYDPDGEIQTVKWDFDDGAREAGLVVDHTFEHAGTYNVKVVVTDNKNESREQIIPVKIKPKFASILLGIIGGLFLVLFIHFIYEQAQKKSLRRNKK